LLFFLLQTHFERTLATFKPSVSSEELKTYEEFTRMFGIEGTAATGEEEEEEPAVQRLHKKSKGGASRSAAM